MHRYPSVQQYCYSIAQVFFTALLKVDRKLSKLRIPTLKTKDPMNVDKEDYCEFVLHIKKKLPAALVKCLMCVNIYSVGTLAVCL